MKAGCIIQGDIRPGFELVVSECARHFECVIISTWEGEAAKIPKGDFEVILNKPPAVSGFSNRNLQRLSAASGLKRARELGCTHILKWRTDLLPTKLNLERLLECSRYAPRPPFESRLVMSAFRNLTVLPDWFSSFPDMFTFGEMELVDLLWNDHGFDYTKPFNIPQEMVKRCQIEFIPHDHSKILIANKTYRTEVVYDAHVECYALFKAKLEQKYGLQLTHEQIAFNLLALIDHTQLGVCWFRRSGPRRFRSMYQAAHVPWWTERRWVEVIEKSACVQRIEFNESISYMTRARSLKERFAGKFLIEKESLLQSLWFWRYKILRALLR